MGRQVLEDDREGKTLSELVGTLAGPECVDSAGLGQQPGARGIDALLMLLGSSGHEYL